LTTTRLTPLPQEDKKRKTTTTTFNIIIMGGGGGGGGGGKKRIVGELGFIAKGFLKSLVDRAFQPNVSRCWNVRELDAAARQRCHKYVYDYIAGGADD